MCEEFDFITVDDIKKSILDYEHGQEKSSTTNYFKYNNLVYPVMNIVKKAIELNPLIEDNKIYDDISCCKNILKKRLQNIIFLGKI